MYIKLWLKLRLTSYAIQALCAQKFDLIVQKKILWMRQDFSGVSNGFLFIGQLQAKILTDIFERFFC
jgi:hypothetical protein